MKTNTYYSDNRSGNLYYVFHVGLYYYKTKVVIYKSVKAQRETTLVMNLIDFERKYSEVKK